MMMCFAAIQIYLFEYERRQAERRNLGQRAFSRLQIRSREIQRITRESDTNCVWELRMDRNAFAILCDLLKNHDGLLDDGSVTIGASLMETLVLGYLLFTDNPKVSLGCVRYL